MATSKWIGVKDKLVLVEAWARNGLIDVQIAKNLGISKDTFYKYKKEHLDFSDSLKRGKEIVDIEVENSLLKRANGYTYTEITKELVTARDEFDKAVKDDNGAIITVLKVTKEITKHMAPDTTAQIFWLKNRKPAEWRDNKHIVSDVNVAGISDEFSKSIGAMSNEELYTQLELLQHE